MNILNLATSDNGGAGQVGRNTNSLFIKRGYRSVLVVKETEHNSKGVIAFKKSLRPGSLGYKLNYYAKRIKGFYQRFFPLVMNENYSFHGIVERKKHISAKQILKRISFNPDVIIIYWVSRFINSQTIADLKKLTGAKILWVLTDNAPMTGGCHYPWNCKGFETNCNDCPGILTSSKKIIVQKNLAFKYENLPKDIEIFVGSSSDYHRASRSLLFKDKKIRWIFPPLDERKFCPAGKSLPRRHFGVEEGKKVIFFGASEFIYLRKGALLFLEAMLLLQTKFRKEKKLFYDYVILIAGKDWQQHFVNTGLPVCDVGYLNEDDLVKAYQAADIFISPSIEDSGPAMVLQSLMCGTPVVAFNTGIAMDVIKNENTGYLAQLGDVTDLANGIHTLLSYSPEKLNEMSKNCRDLAIKKFSTENYLDALIGAFPHEKNIKRITSFQEIKKISNY